MRSLLLLMFFSLIYMVSGKNNVKTLTESMGQEVIEIGTPIKELPMGLEEEPAADNDEDITEKVTSNTIMPATKKDVKKTALVDNRKKMKDVEIIDGMSQDDEEARIEKELAEIYKDTADYKSENAEEPVQEVKEAPKAEPINDPPPSEDPTSSEEIDKPIGRQKTNPNFEPESTDKAAIDRFRTSIDDMSCVNRQKLSGTKTTAAASLVYRITPLSGSTIAFDTVRQGITVVTVLFCYVFICT